MVIVGEKINTSLKGITEAIKEKNKIYIQELAIKQSCLSFAASIPMKIIKIPPEKVI